MKSRGAYVNITRLPNGPTHINSSISQPRQPDSTNLRSEIPTVKRKAHKIQAMM